MSWCLRNFAGAALFALSFACAFANDADRTQAVGLPPTRFYPLDEIGSVSRGTKLDFDALGRLAVIDEGVYVVLNDNAWIDLIEKQYHADSPIHVALSSPENPVYYYGAVGSWGILETRRDGTFHPQPLCPENPPAWVRSTNFDQIIARNDGAYIAGVNGVVFWSKASRTCTFFEVSNTALFSRAGRIYLSSRDRGIFEIAAGVVNPVPFTGVAFLPGEAVEKTAMLDDQRVILATTYNRLLQFDGATLKLWAPDAPWPTTIPWEPGSQDFLAEKITAIEHLADGELAVAVRKKGLFILSASGELLQALTGPDNEDINDVAAREEGIVWISTLRGIQKIYYKSPITVVDQRINVMGTWPTVIGWGSKTLIAASGRLYEQGAPSQPKATAIFHPMSGFGTNQFNSVAAVGSTLMVGNNQEVIAISQGLPPTLILNSMDVDKVAELTPDTCLVIGRRQITALRLIDGKWRETFDRIPGHGFAYLTYKAKNSVWVEYGVNRVARIYERDGKLHADLMESFPWNEARWVNIGVVDNYVVLTGPANGRVFFDEDTGAFCDAPELQKVLQSSPYWFSRAAKDSDGTIWGSHEQGVVRFTKGKNGYTCDGTTMELVKERHSALQIIHGNDVWLSTGTILYHVNENANHAKIIDVRPVLASITDVRTGTQLFGAGAEASPYRFPYSENSLSFRFFAGGYRLQLPTYEFRMNDKSDSWSALGSDSLLNLPNLREGTYEFQVRLVDSRGPVGDPLSIRFEIAPPWYRTWLALSAYAAAGISIIIGIFLWWGYSTRRRNVALEKLVGERTEALRQAMEKLHEETRNAATLEERGRLANEIHDSVQQGLSGLMLQIDSTLKLPEMDKDIRSRLDVARKMVAFTREELRHALWDLESPLLEHNELGEALRRTAAVVSPESPRIEVEVLGESFALNPSTQHHLLRIAQEALTNAVRHSSAQHIRVSLRYGEESVSISVIDDGVGFQTKEVPANTINHFGLRSIRTRASKVGGDLKVQSSTNHGTSLTVVVPKASHPSSSPNAAPNR